MDKITEEHIWEGRRLIVTWHGSSFVAPRHLVTQASGICFTDEGLIVLVTGNGESWGLPGGHPETGETLEDAFIREVREEACATVTNLVSVGISEVNDPGNPEGFPINYKARFWARVQLDEFEQEYETTGRKMVAPEDLITTLNWYPAGIIEAILRSALDCEQKFNANQPQQP